MQEWIASIVEKTLHLSWLTDEQCYTEDWDAESPISSSTARQEEATKVDARCWSIGDYSWEWVICRSKTKYLVSFFIVLNVFVSRTDELIGSLCKEIWCNFSWLCLFQIYLDHRSAVSSMDVDDEANSLATYSESRDAMEKQSERKKKSHGNWKLRKLGKILEAIASLSTASVDQSVSVIPKGNVGRKVVRNRSISFHLYSFVRGDRSSQQSMRERSSTKEKKRARSWMNSLVLQIRLIKSSIKCYQHLFRVKRNWLDFWMARVQ